MCDSNMSDVTKIVFTSSLTILGGLFLFVVGQITSKFIIDPIHDLKKTIGDIRYSLSFHARSIHTPLTKDELSDQAQDDLRKLSCLLRVKVDLIPCYKLFSIISCLPSKTNALEAASFLMGLSNSVHNEDRSKNSARTDKIVSLLNLEPLE